MKPRSVLAATVLIVFIAAGLSLAQRGGQPAGVPDLVVSRMDFQKVQSGKDSQNNAYWIFNVIVHVKNQGAASAGPFKVLLERNNGAGGSFQVACQTCTIDAGGLGAGQETALPPRQFNNANAMPSQFRATADSGHAVNEGNENNNSRTEGFVSLSVGDAGRVPGPLLKGDLVAEIAFQNYSTHESGGKITAKFDLAVTVKNNGPGGTPATLLMARRGNDPMVMIYSIAPDKTVPQLAAGAQAVIMYPGLSFEAGPAIKYFDATVDPYHKIEETNESNNRDLKQAPWAK